MNLAGKIFIVLNLVLGVAFAVATLSLYAKRVDWVKEANVYLTARNKLDTDLEKLTTEHNKLRSDYRDLKTDTGVTITELEKSNTQLGKNFTNLRKDSDKIATDMNKVALNIVSMNSTLTTLEETKQKLEADLQQANETKDKAIRDRDYERRRAIEAVADLNEAESELESHNMRMASLMEQNIEVRIALEKFRKRYGSLPSMVTKTPVVPVRGKVLRVREEVDLVMINLGEKDKLTPGMELVISRGSDYIGKIKISKLYENMASAIIDREMTIKPIRKGDTAETL